MDKFLEFLVDNIGTIFMIVFGALFIYGFYNLINSANEAADKRQAETQRLTEACYSQGMVLIDTDAGQRCADPRSLVKVK
jgi:hypothetical protein